MAPRCTATRRASADETRRFVVLRLSAQIGLHQFDDFVAAAVENRAQHVKAEALGLRQLDGRRHGEFMFVRDDVHERRALMRECLFQRALQFFGILDAKRKMPAPFAICAKSVLLRSTFVSR